MIPVASCRFFPILALILLFATIAQSQAPVASTWEGAQANLVNEKHTLYVVTIAHPKIRHTCIVQSVNASEIVCSQHGHAIDYLAKDVAALIDRGTHSRWYFYSARFLAAAGAATWGTVALAPVCVPCAVFTGIAALFLYQLAGLSGMISDGDFPDELLYLAPGQTLKVSLRRP